MHIPIVYLQKLLGHLVGIYPTSIGLFQQKLGGYDLVKEFKHNFGKSISSGLSVSGAFSLVSY